MTYTYILYNTAIINYDREFFLSPVITVFYFKLSLTF